MAGDADWWRGNPAYGSPHMNGAGVARQGIGSVHSGSGGHSSGGHPAH
jgi:hypothetical protein